MLLGWAQLNFFKITVVNKVLEVHRNLFSDKKDKKFIYLGADEFMAWSYLDFSYQKFQNGRQFS